MATKRPTAVLVLENDLKWRSCKSISANLRRDYRRVLGEGAVTIPYVSSPTLGDLWAMAQSIRKSDPLKLVFLDHVPHPLPLLRALRGAYGRKQFPGLIFHVYGDFTLYPDQWLATGELLKNERCTFLCASPRHSRLIAGFLRKAESSIRLLPFPVNTRQFFHDEKLRKAWREKLRVPNGTRVLLYSGRISLQKNVTQLIEAFAALPQNGRNTILLLAGAEDDLDAPPFGIHHAAGTYGTKVRQLIERQKNVRWLGSVPSRSMNALYNAADAFVSLSLHHDEDYGMAVAEAQCTGLPCLLTDWGGFSSFIQEPGQGTLIPVKMGKRGLALPPRTLKSKFTEFLCSPHRVERRRLAAKHRALFSPANGAAALERIISEPPEPFRGFSALLSKLAFRAASRSAPTFPQNSGAGSLYAKIYGPYHE
jgi:glycosyltransferase involved in cell wall biosynthesis